MHSAIAHKNQRPCLAKHLEFSA